MRLASDAALQEAVRRGISTNRPSGQDVRVKAAVVPIG